MITDVDVLRAALIGYEQERSKLDEKIAELRKQIDGKPGRAALSSMDGAAPLKQRRRLSAAARKRIAEAQKRRWAKFHAKKK